MTAWELTERDNGLLVLTFDEPGEKVNVLRKSNMEELQQQLKVAAAEHPHALLIESGKQSGFIAGADIRAIADVETEAEGEAASRLGQQVFAQLASLPFPTVALIHGACIGGGLELALACRHRVASADPGTQLGLPEVQLGILPGFGGTQRMVRLLGLPAALPLLLTGRRLAARAARKIGLVDAVSPREALPAAAARILQRSARIHRLPRRNRALEKALQAAAPLRNKIIEKARRDVQKKTGGMFPAPFKILEAVAASYLPRGEGFDVEARLLGELVVSPVSRNLVRLFLMSETAREVGESPAIERATVVGAGTMGAGIAAALVGAGVRTRLIDSLAASLVRGAQLIRKSMKRKVRRQGGGSAQLTAAMDLLEPSSQLVGLGRQQLFLEAIIEDMKAKQDLLQQAARDLPADALIATNTSSLDLDEMASVLSAPDRLVGIHFFNPVHRMRLVEIVQGKATSAAAVAAARGLVRRLGKVPVVVKNSPGFLVNRLLTPYLLEAELLVEEGVSVTDLDQAAREAGMPMGPLELLDEIGLDVAALVATTMSNAFPDRFQPGQLVRLLAERGALGKKSGRGFYVYGKRRGVNPDVPRAAQPTRSPRSEWADRLLLPVLAEAFRCLEEGIVAAEDDVDLAMLLGTGFQLAGGGPLHSAAARGWQQVCDALQLLEQNHGSRFAAPAALKRRAQNPKELVR